MALSLAGNYVRYSNGAVDKNKASFIIGQDNEQVTLQADTALAEATSNTSVNTSGHLEGSMSFEGNPLVYSDGMSCTLNLNFSDNALSVTGDNGQCAGTNLTFNGQYKKAGTK
jgi:hypothetical protein